VEEENRKTKEEEAPEEWNKAEVVNWKLSSFSIGQWLPQRWQRQIYETDAQVVFECRKCWMKWSTEHRNKLVLISNANCLTIPKLKETNSNLAGHLKKNQ
jgi:hypothetical protein